MSRIFLLPRQIVTAIRQVVLQCLILSTCALPVLAQNYLWQIGVFDTNDMEFALAPGNYSQYSTTFPNDPLYVVGQSSAGTAWPYCHPGPLDAWAGSKQHTFTVVFGIQNVAASGNCQLNFELLDTQSSSPPTLAISINGTVFDENLPPGAGDASIFGTPSTGKEYAFSVIYPVNLLHAGVNSISITTQSGSWFLYDWLGLNAPAGTMSTNVSAATLITQAQQISALVQTNSGYYSPISIGVTRIGPATNALLQIGNGPVLSVNLGGYQTFTVLAPEVQSQSNLTATISVGGSVVATQAVSVSPVRHLTLYVLPHSHVDIGYTDYQTNTIAKQVANLVQAIQYAQQTATNPPGARFIWNLEAAFIAEVYLNTQNAAARTNFFNAVANGQVEISGLYCNDLTGLCRSEELVHAFSYAKKLESLTGVPIHSTMLSDVVNATWGTVTAAAQAGIKYFSDGPNQSARIGYAYDWQNKPFYWFGPDGQSKILTWISFEGYSMSHGYSSLTASLPDVLHSLDQVNYPYNIAYVRWSGHGDNAVPEPSICNEVLSWNAQYAYPKLVISGTTAAFQALENSYNNSIPVVSGDRTPSWEDGAGSSALETGISRNGAERLTQAETLYAIINRFAYPASLFNAAWTNVLLYSEHTWGAYDSYSSPNDPFVAGQWTFKQNYALQAGIQSSNLLLMAENASSNTNIVASAVDVFNTLCWPRTEIVYFPAQLSSSGDRVLDDQGQPVPSQRIRTGELAVFVNNIPALAARRYTVVAGSAYIPPTGSQYAIGGFSSAYLATGSSNTASASASAISGTLDNGWLHVQLDPITGGIAGLTATGITGNLVDTSGGETLNEYLYQVGSSLPTPSVRNGPVTISVGDNGSLVSSLIVQSSAPGCNSLSREIRLIAGQDYVFINDLLNKSQVVSNTHEAVNIAFPFNIPGGNMLVDIPLGAMRPELDQMDGACKNWLCVNRWVDITNQNYGVTWTTLDAPLVQLGSITAMSGYPPSSAFLRTNRPGQEIYSYAMNNAWETNYRQNQKGLTPFRYIIRPHLPSSPVEATRFAATFSQPLLPVTARGATPISNSLVAASSPDVVVLGVKPSDDGTALIVRLFGANGKSATANLSWAQTPVQLWISDTSEKPLSPVSTSGPVSVPAWGMVTLRAQM